KPEILILDEATSALDNRSEELITQTIYSLPITTIIVAHRLSTIAQADKIVVFKNGEIVCTGTREELLQNCPEFQRLYYGGGEEK
ncbi:MAG: ABC transporter permease, partial [Epsilonproteobacteria bacterium]|nr:ABC transporter permease [Campylobacterota bacterium]NPA88861.1 ABC transporter ATP-binding protein [Campylobacterota bacterium]